MRMTPIEHRGYRAAVAIRVRDESQVVLRIAIHEENFGSCDRESGPEIPGSGGLTGTTFGCSNCQVPGHFRSTIRQG
jgi:hypothetical protein